MKQIDVDACECDRCLNNRKMPVEINGFIKLHSPEYYKFLAQYKFNTAFENAMCNYYITEKLFCTFEVGAIPVVKDWMPNEK